LKHTPKGRELNMFSMFHVAMALLGFDLVAVIFRRVFGLRIIGLTGGIASGMYSCVLCGQIGKTVRWGDG